MRVEILRLHDCFAQDDKWLELLLAAGFEKSAAIVGISLVRQDADALSIGMERIQGQIVSIRQNGRWHFEGFMQPS